MKQVFYSLSQFTLYCLKGNSLDASHIRMKNISLLLEKSIN